MKFIPLIFYPVIALMMSFNLSAQTDSVMKFSLSEAQSYAIENFFMSKNAALDIEYARNRVWEITAIGLPQITGGVDYTYIPEVPEASFGGEYFLASTVGNNEFVTGADLQDPSRVGLEFNEFEPIKLAVEQNVSYNVMLNQLLFSGEYIVGLKAARTYKQLTVESFEKQSIGLKEMVAGTYYSLLILEKNQELLEGTVENLKKIYSDTKKTSDQGLLEETEADQIAINVKRTENSLNANTRQIEFMSRMLKYQLGLNVESEIVLTDDLGKLIDINLIDLTNLINFNLENHIDYRLLDTQERLNTLLVKREESMYLPTLSAFYKYEDLFEKATLDFTMRHMVGVNLSVPIFQSGMKSASVSMAKIELEKSQNMKTQESQRLFMEADQAKLDYLTALETYNNELDNFYLSRKILDYSIEKYSYGIISSMDLTLANNQYLEAQLSLSTAILYLLNAKINLDKAYSQL
ncbi:hypothetical protein ES705_13390 [subsurface metagenome]